MICIKPTCTEYLVIVIPCYDSFGFRSCPLPGPEKLAPLGIGYEAFSEAALRGFNAKGVLIGISPSILNNPDFTISAGDPGEGDLKIHCPAGLPVEFISGIEPLGDAEYRLLESLQEKG